MNSREVSKLFPTGTVIVAYKGKSIGGAKMIPRWKIEALVSETSHLRPQDGILADLRVENSISLEFEAVNPQQLDSSHEFDNLAGELSFIPLDPEKKVAYCFPVAELKAEPEIKNNCKGFWKFQILCDDNGVFMKKIKANG